MATGTAGSVSKDPETGEVDLKFVEKMHYLERPKVLTGLHRINYVKILPRSPLDVTDTTEVEFRIPATTTDHIDLAEVRLFCEFSLSKRDDEGGEELAFNPGTLKPGVAVQDKQIGDIKYKSTMEADNAEIAYVIDDFGETMWSNIRVQLNGTTVYSSNNDQHYRAYMNTRLRTVNEEMEFCEYTKMYNRDDPKTATDSANPFVAKNLPAVKRFMRTNNRQIIQLSSIIRADLLQDVNHFLPNGIEVFISLTPAPNKFRLMATPASLVELVNLNLANIWLEVPYVTLGTGALKGLDSGLRSSDAMFPFVRSEFKIIPMHKGIREMRCPEIFDRQLPIDLVIAMVPMANFAGAYHLNPFFFLRNKIESAAFYVDNVSIPGEPYVFGEDTLEEPLAGRKGHDETLMVPLLQMYNVAGTHHNGFNLNTYKDGAFFICFNTDPTVPSNVPYWGVPKTGNTSLVLRFKEPIPEEQELLILARFPGLVKASHSRQITVR
jgi:hypothetical protein